MKTMNGNHIKNIIIETDCGHDSDDFFALCYLMSVGVNIRAITLDDGDPYQVAITKCMCKEMGLDIPIGVATLNRPQPNNPHDFHRKFLTAMKYPHEASHDGLGSKIIANAFSQYPDSEMLIIGPPKSMGAFIKENIRASISQVTFQGGFMGYNAHKFPCERLPKFEGKTSVPSFNPNGAVQSTIDITNAPQIKKLRFVSKNVCHLMTYDKTIHELYSMAPTKNRADEMFKIGMDIYLQKHPSKNFHDPCAAVCMLHPEIANWVRGKMTRIDGGWATIPDETSNSETIASIDKDKFWEYIIEGK